MGTQSRNSALKYIVVCHDSGGAELVSAYIKYNLKPDEYLCYLAGPAKDIFQKKGIDFEELLDSASLLSLCDILSPLAEKGNTSNNPPSPLVERGLGGEAVILTGTGWGSNIENEAIKFGKENNIKTISILDNWVNYRERFGYPKDNWLKNLPDEVWVCDNYAYNLAITLGFPSEKLKKIKNYYFKEILSNLPSPSGRGAGGEGPRNSPHPAFGHPLPKVEGILYLSQPTSEHMQKQHGDPLYLGFNEYSILEDILSLKIPVTIRLHPSEIKTQANKYDKYLNEKVSLSKNLSLEKDLLDSKIIIGSNSMALVIALLLGKKAVSYVPSNKIEQILPHKGILKINFKNELLNILNLAI